MSRFLIVFCLLVGILLADVQTLHAQCNWSPAVNLNWNVGANWSCGHAPGPSDDVFINGTTVVDNGFVLSPIVKSLSIASPFLQFGNNISGLTVAGTSTATPAYTLKVTSSTIRASNPSFSLNATGPSPVIITSSLFGNPDANKFPVVIDNNRTTGNDVSDQAVVVTSSSLLGNFTCSARTFKFTSNTFNGTTTITKKNPSGSTGTVDALNNALNTFNSTTTLVNSDAGNVSWGNGDSFPSSTAQVSITNNFDGNFFIASSTTSPTTTFNGPVTFTNAASGKIILSNNASNTVNFAVGSSKQIAFNHTGTSAPVSPAVPEIQIGNSGTVNFTSSSLVIFGGLNPYSIITVGVGSSSSVVLGSTSSFKAGRGGFVNPYLGKGILVLAHLTANGEISFDLSNGVCVDIKPGCVFNNTVNASGYCFSAIGGTYNASTSFSMSAGSTADQTTDTYDLLTFNKNISFTNKSTNTWNIGGMPSLDPLPNRVNFNSSSPKSSVTMQTITSGDLLFGYNKGEITLDKVNLQINRYGGSGPTTSSIIGSVVLGVKANVTIKSDNLSSDAARTNVSISQNSTNMTKRTAFGSSTGTDLGTLTFSGVFTTTNLYAGIVSFGRFNAKEDVTFATPVSPYLVSTTLVELSPDVFFEKNTSIQCPNISGNGGVFGTAPASPTGPSSYTWTTFFTKLTPSTAPSYFIGNPVFNGPVTITNNANTTASFIMGNTSGDVFTYNSHVTVNKVGTGDVRTSGAGISNYKGNYTYNGVPDVTPMYGQSVFDGAIDQDVTVLPAGNALNFSLLEINKPTLSTVVLKGLVSVLKPVPPVTLTIPARLKLSAGNIKTTSAYLLTLGDEVIIEDGGNNSFVDGPLRKTGSIPSVSPYEFKFQVGKTVMSGTTITDRVYMPFSITMPVSATSDYTAEFLNKMYSPITTGGMLTTGLADFQVCQYWSLKQNGTQESIAVLLPWDNDGKTCSSVNPGVVCVAQSQTSPQWKNVGAHVTSSGNSGIVKSDVLVAPLTGSYIYFTLGYRNVLSISTGRTNPTKFQVENNVEPTELFTSGSLGSKPGSTTFIACMTDYNGYTVIHPSFSSVVDLTIDRQLSGEPTDPKAKYANYSVLKGKIYTSAEGAAAVVDHVTIDEDGDNTFLPLSTDVHTISGTSLRFYKEKEAPLTFDLSNNLTDALTYTVNRYLTTPYAPFQITSAVPSGYSATLKVYDITDAMVASNNTDLTWNGKIDATTFFPEGLYHYEVVLTNETITKSYKGQLILKHQ